MGRQIKLDQMIPGKFFGIDIIRKLRFNQSNEVCSVSQDNIINSQPITSESQLLSNSDNTQICATNSTFDQHSITAIPNTNIEIPINSLSQPDSELNNDPSLNSQPLDDFNQNSTPDLIPFALTTNVIIPPTESKLINVQLIKKEQLNKNLIIAIPTDIPVQGIHYEPSLCEQNKGKFQIQIDNLRGCELNLSKGTIIGKAEICDFDQNKAHNFIHNEYPNDNNDNHNDNNINQNFSQINSVSSNLDRSTLFDTEFQCTDYPELELEIKSLLQEFDDVVALTKIL